MQTVPLWRTLVAGIPGYRMKFRRVARSRAAKRLPDMYFGTLAVASRLW